MSFEKINEVSRHDVFHHGLSDVSRDKNPNFLSAKMFPVQNIFLFSQMLWQILVYVIFA